VLSVLSADRSGATDVQAPAVLLVTHDIDEAATVADRMAVLLDGGLRQDDVPAVVLSTPHSLSVARFLGLPNVVEGVCASGVFTSAVGRSRCSLPDGPAWLVSRSDGFSVRGSASAARRPSSGLDGLAVSDGVSGIVSALEQRVSGALVRVRVPDGPRGYVELLCRSDASTPSTVGDAVAVLMDPARVHVMAARETSGVAGDV
jgi:ABC-type sulfate/molybdate transport systems ATPase subunit